MTPTCRKLELDRCVREDLELIDGKLEYPKAVLTRGVQGVASASCLLREDGTVDECLVRSRGEGMPMLQGVDLGSELKTYLERRKYTPVTSGGRAVEVASAFDVKVRASADSELAWGERALSARLLRLLRSRLGGTSRKRICVDAPALTTREQLQSVAPEFVPPGSCGVPLRGEYIELQSFHRGSDGMILAFAAVGTAGAGGTSIVLRGASMDAPFETIHASDYEE